MIGGPGRPRRVIAPVSASRIRWELIAAILYIFYLPASPALCSIRALRIRPGGAVTTSPSVRIPVDSDMTLRVLLKRNPWDLVAHDILTVSDTAGNRRLSLGVNTSPWVSAYVSDRGWGTSAHIYGADGAVARGCLSGQAYEDWWLVYKAPTGASDGYFEVLRNGVTACYDNLERPFRIAIPAGTDMSWKGGSLMLRLGDTNTSTMADYQALDVCWWTAALPDADIAAIGARQIAGIADDVRHTSDILWYARPSNASSDRIACELGQCAGDAALDAVFSGDVTYTADTPRNDGWELPDDITPPDPGPAPLTATATDTSITATAQQGSDTALRYVAVSEGTLWPYTCVQNQQFDTVGPAEACVTGLAPGRTYYVTGEWQDAAGNTTTRQLSVTTTGQAAPPEGPTRALHITGGAEAVTALNADGTQPTLFRMPFDCDATIRLLVRCDAQMTGPCWFFSQRADAAGAYGYARFAIGLDQYGMLFGKVTDGQLTFEANSHHPVSSRRFEEVWLVYAAPTSFTDGSLTLYRGSTCCSSVAIPAGTDMTWKKWDAQFVLGGLADGLYNGSIDYEILEPAWWTRALTAEQMAVIGGRPLYALDDSDRLSGDLYWYARPHVEEGRIVPDLGASIGTALMRQQGIYTHGRGTIAPVIVSGLGGSITYTDDVPPGFGGAPYTMGDLTGALAMAAGMSRSPGLSARLNIANTGASTDCVDLADCIRLARVLAGLETIGDRGEPTPPQS